MKYFKIFIFLKKIYSYYFLNDFYFFHYSWFTVFCQFSTVQQGDPVTHTCTHSFLTLSCPIRSEQIKFPVLYSRISLLIHSKGNSLHLLIPDTQSIPLPYPLGNHQSVFQVHEFLFCGKVRLCHILDFRYVISYGICFSLSDLLHLV